MQSNTPSNAISALEKFPPHRLDNDAHVEHERPILNVLQVGSNTGLCEVRIHRAAAETPSLRKARETGPYAVTLEVAWNENFIRNSCRQHSWHMRARTHQ